jgi:hypothetical protein
MLIVLIFLVVHLLTIELGVKNMPGLKMKKKVAIMAYIEKNPKIIVTLWLEYQKTQ